MYLRITWGRDKKFIRFENSSSSSDMRSARPWNWCLWPNQEWLIILWRSQLQCLSAELIESDVFDQTKNHLIILWRSQLHCLSAGPTCLNLRRVQRNLSWKWNSANSTTCVRQSDRFSFKQRCQRREKVWIFFLNLRGDQVENPLALEHVEVRLHLLEVGEALVL